MQTTVEISVHRNAFGNNQSYSRQTVQIPSIERNAVAAMRAISSVTLSRFLYSTRKISFDEVVTTMYQTGLDMDEKYRETSHGGLAEIYYTE